MRHSEGARHIYEVKGYVAEIEATKMQYMKQEAMVWRRTAVALSI
jgi:hypothetical protein